MNMLNLEKNYVRTYISQHYEAWDPRIFENYDVKKAIKTIDDIDPDTVIVTARTHNGYWFCDVGWGGVHLGLKGVDQLDEFISHFHKKGKPVVAYFSTVYDKEIYDRHPNWRQVDKEGAPVAGYSGSWGKVVCLNSPYREYLLSMVMQLIKTHDIDGILFDMTFFDLKPCYCENCKRLFKSTYDGKIPEIRNYDDKSYRDFLKFRMNSNISFSEEIYNTVKNENQDIAVYMQYPMLKRDSITGQSLKIGKIPDYIYSDLYFLQSGYLGMSVYTKINSVISRNIPEIGIMTRPGSHNDTPNMKSLDHLRSEAFTVISNGGAVHFFDIMWSDGTLQKSMWNRINKVGKEIKEREEYLGGKRISSVGVYYSENTRIWYGREDMVNRYESNFLGVCRSLIEEHIPYNIITELSNEILSCYQVLVLPNTVCMSDEEVGIIENYVKKGGGLVATGKTSLWNEEGEPCSDYKLGSILGISHKGNTGTYSRVYSKFNTKEKIASRLEEDGFITNWGDVEKITLINSKSCGNIVYPYTEPNGDKFINIMANPPASKSSFPCCAINEYGLGKTVYFPSNLDKDYLVCSFPELKWLITDAIRYASKEPINIQLKAPMCVELNAYEKNDGTMVIHLVNFQPENGKYFTDLEFESRHLIQEILPVYNLVLKVKAEKIPSKIMMQPENMVLNYDIEEEFIIIKIPHLDCHSMVVIKY